MRRQKFVFKNYSAINCSASPALKFCRGKIAPLRHVVAMKREDSPFPDASPLPAGVADFPLLDALRQRRSRRFGLGMKLPAGPLAFESKHPPRPLTEDEEAAMVFAACGITGHALADLCYLGLMAQALGLGGFPNFANHEFAWFQSLGFRLEEMPVNRYVGAGWLPSLAMKFLGRNPAIPYPVGLERNGEVLLKPFCPPYYKSMGEAVRAVAEIKFGANGVFRSQDRGSAWTDHDGVVKQVPAVSEAALAAATAHCEYLWQRYGRFPVYLPPYRTVLNFQASHLDTEFYDRFYRPEALSQTQRQDSKRNG